MNKPELSEKMRMWAKIMNRTEKSTFDTWMAAKFGRGSKGNTTENKAHRRGVMRRNKIKSQKLARRRNRAA